MLVQCPSCAAKYVVNPTQLGGAGRTVRCAKCATTWYQEANQDPLSTDEINNLLGAAPSPQEAEPSPASIIAAAAAGLDHQDNNLTEDQPVMEPSPAMSAEDMAQPLPAEAPLQPNKYVPALASKNYQRPTPGWVGLFAFVLLVVGFGGLARSDIVDIWEPSARLYQAVGLPVDVLGQGLEFRDIKAEHIAQDNGEPLLILEGKVVNTSTGARPIPLIKGTLRTEQQEDLQSWTFMASSQRLLPGESALFKTELKNPTKGAEAISITFAKPANG